VLGLLLSEHVCARELDGEHLAQLNLRRADHMLKVALHSLQRGQLNYYRQGGFDRATATDPGGGSLLMATGKLEVLPALGMIEHAGHSFLSVQDLLHGSAVKRALKLLSTLRRRAYIMLQRNAGSASSAEVTQLASMVRLEQGTLYV
jgi:hypothetical protein